MFAGGKLENEAPERVNQHSFERRIGHITIDLPSSVVVPNSTGTCAVLLLRLETISCCVLTILPSWTT